MPKQWFIILAAVLGAIFLLATASLILGAVSVARGGETETAEENTLTVYGQGLITVQPDIATVTLGYENSASSPELAQQGNTDTMARITAALREQGVAEGDIVETQFNVYQEYYYGDYPEAQSYRVSRIFSVTVRDVAEVSDIIAAACNAGANTSYGITYDVSNRQEIYARALELARGRADEKAGELAASLGCSLAGIAEVRESGAVPSAGEYEEYGCSLLTDYVTDDSAVGPLEIEALVTVTYRLE
jgi:uncharacterized protein YggE